MFRKAILTATLGVPLLFAGCATNSNGNPTFAGVSAAEVQTDIMTICSFVPTAESLASIIAAALSSGIPGLASAEGIAQGVCQAVIQAAPTVTLRRQMTRGAIQPTFLNVPIQGRFIR